MSRVVMFAGKGGVGKTTCAAAAALHFAAGEPPVLAELTFRGDKNLWLRTPQAEIEFAGAVTLHSTEDYIGLTGGAQV